MKNVLGKNIARLRKEKKLTQEALAAQLRVSFQAISKWETGQSYPDIELLPQITNILETNIDALLGHVPGDAQKTIYHNLYEQEAFYWGLQPSELCYEVLKRYPPNGHVRLLEVGCGEGRDALFFARNGYEVTAFDIAQAGVDKVRWLSDKFNIYIRAFRADMMEYRLEEDYDIVYSSRSLHHIRQELRSEVMEDYKAHTREQGIHALNVYVDKPFIAPSPEYDEFAFLWTSGELFSYYADWQLEQINEEIYPCTSSGVPHHHAINTLLAGKPGKRQGEMQKEGL